MDRILIIDDSTSFLTDIESLLNDRYIVRTATTARRGLELARTEGVAAVLLDLGLPDMNGRDVLLSLHREVDAYLPVIIVTDQSDTETAVELMRLGAYDFLSKSFNRDILSAKLSKALERRSLELSVRALQSSFAEHHDRLVFASDGMKKVDHELTRLARLSFDVLIQGETGTGKDLCAFEIHQRSPRRDRPFIALAMRTLSESLIESELFGHEKGSFSGADRAKVGKIEAANGGTLYIPEVSSLTESVQLKLLQFMQYKSIARVGQDPRRPETRLDVRVIMATNENLEEVVNKGRMREDFFHRITGVRLTIPPLRERVADIGILAEYFLRKFTLGTDGEVHRFGPGVMEAMTSYRWPGNVRELENAIKGALAYCENGELLRSDFPNLVVRPVEANLCRTCLADRYASMPAFREVEMSFRRGYLEELMRRTQGNVATAARIAGLTGPGLRKALRTCGVERERRNSHNGNGQHQSSSGEN
jgi:DNA-binding NtrC family response regulator